MESNHGFLDWKKNSRNFPNFTIPKIIEFPLLTNSKKKESNSWNFRISKISKFSKFDNLYNYRNSKNFEFDGKLSYIWSVRTIQTDVNIRWSKKPKKNRETQLLLFQYSKFRIFEISAVLHLVVPNLDPHPK